MNIREVLKIFTLIEGAFVIGVTVVLLQYYFTAQRNKGMIKLRIVYALCTLSYILVIWGTSITMFRSPYDLKDKWYWIVFIGYLLGDIGLILGLAIAYKRKRAEQ